MTATTVTKAELIVERLQREDAARVARINADAAELRGLYADREFARATLDAHNRDNPTRRAPRDGSELQPNAADRKRVSLEADIDRITRAIVAMEKKRAERPRFVSGANLADFLKRVGRRAREVVVEPKLKKGETRTDAIARMDSEIDASKAERKRIASTPRTADEILDAACATIDRLAARGAPRMAGMLQGGELEMPTFQLQSTVGHHFQFGPDGVGLLCWLMRDEIKDRLAQHVQVFATDDSAMTADEQAAAITKLDASILKLHRERAALVEEIVADGGEATHRADAPPEAILGIAV